MTMRRLIVLRHAKSDWDTKAQGDHARPLNERGRRDAPRMGKRLRELGWVPQVVVSSDAVRTRETWARIEDALGGEPTVTFTSAFYLAGIEAIRAALSELPGNVETAMVIGHNDGWENALYELSGVRVRLTTCNAALLHTTAEHWSDAAARSDWALEELLRPKEL
ncbi:SixA phosphatase family protein [Paraliomyxa miuraensis]|uniref:SixA phosphatase family protein n=1 Tax=Paraliomyxa miuraensis TaxID=376150 RepID=UPI00225C3806|nr:histidine phosphatase family protein [Paraliomyxa miuraensis]MCX4240568.1 histidine phosphatase family protein [Paraliomyxa miuraensis]